jgi:hypothetical protein
MRATPWVNEREIFGARPEAVGAQNRSRDSLGQFLLCVIISPGLRRQAYRRGRCHRVRRVDTQGGAGRTGTGAQRAERIPRLFGVFPLFSTEDNHDTFSTDSPSTTGASTVPDPGIGPAAPVGTWATSHHTITIDGTIDEWILTPKACQPVVLGLWLHHLGRGVPVRRLAPGRF